MSFHEDFWAEMMNFADMKGYENRYTKYESHFMDFYLEMFFLFPDDAKKDFYVASVDEDTGAYRLKRSSGTGGRKVWEKRFRTAKELGDALRKELAPVKEIRYEQMRLF